MNAEQLQTHLCALEERLLHPDREQDRSELASLLAEEFKEFGASGRIFNRTQIIEMLHEANPRSAHISHFCISPLAEGVVLATYHTTKLTAITHRSSIWVFRDNRWQMVFHQGTPAL